MSKIGNVKKRHYRSILYRSVLKSIGIFNFRSESNGLRKFIRKNKYSSLILTLSAFLFAVSLVSFGNLKFEQFLLANKPSDLQSEPSDNIVQDSLVLGDRVQIQAEDRKNYSGDFVYEDKRVYVLDQYFKSRNSPLYGQAIHFVEACDTYGAPKDCITTTAIARHETDLCKYIYSAEMHNCMGWGGAGEYRQSFNSFKEHIYVATDVLVNQYGVEYMIDPELMEDVFCGPQAECEGWGDRVKILMEELDSYSESIGMGRLSDLRES